MGVDMLIRCLKTYEGTHLPGIKLLQWKKIRAAMWTVVKLLRVLKARPKVCFIT